MAGLEVVCLYQIYAYIKYAYNESLLYVPSHGPPGCS